MRIVHIITSLRIGGAEAALYNRLRLMASEYEHHVIYFYDGPFVEKIKQLNISVYKVSGLYVLYDPVFFIRLYRLIVTINPHVIHSVLWFANMLSRFFGIMLHIPVINELHNEPHVEGRIKFLLDAYTMRYASYLVMVSHSVRQARITPFVAWLNKNIENKVMVIPNGVDCTYIDVMAQSSALCRKDFGIPRDAFVIGSVGRFEPEKGYYRLIEAFASLRMLCNAAQTERLYLLLVGDGSCKNQLIQLVKKLHIEKKVIFAGVHFPAYGMYTLMDCFALASQSEGLSIALLDAMYMNLPVIVGNTTSKHDVIVHGVHGIIVTELTAQAYAQGLKMIIDDTQHDIGSNNRACIQHYHSLSRAIDNYRALYQVL